MMNKRQNVTVCKCFVSYHCISAISPLVTVMRLETIATFLLSPSYVKCARRAQSLTNCLWRAPMQSSGLSQPLPQAFSIEVFLEFAAIQRYYHAFMRSRLPAFCAASMLALNSSTFFSRYDMQHRLLMLSGSLTSISETPSGKAPGAPPPAAGLG